MAFEQSEAEVEPAHAEILNPHTFCYDSQNVHTSTSQSARLHKTHLLRKQNCGPTNQATRHGPMGTTSDGMPGDEGSASNGARVYISNDSPTDSAEEAEQVRVPHQIPAVVAHRLHIRPPHTIEMHDRNVFGNDITFPQYHKMRAVRQR